MTQLADACDDLAAWLPRAAALTATQDSHAATMHAQPSSRPPWNPGAATAVYDALETIRRAEQQIRTQVTGRAAGRQPHARTGAALRAIPRLAEALDGDDQAIITGQLTHAVTRLLELDAIDQAEPWHRISGAVCTFCGHTMLRTQYLSGKVTCLRYGACFDSNGQHPMGFMSVGAASGQPLIAWADGTTQHPAVAA